MSVSLVDPGVIRPWIVCETGTRWITGLRRFAPEIMPSELVPQIHVAPRSKTLSMLTHAGPTIVLWEVQPDGLAVSCECLAQAAMLAPGALQIVAAAGLTMRERLVIAGFRISATIEHPEDLVSLKPMIHRYFARSAQHLD
ncbi:MAG: hypothetical protein ACR2NZ_00065 [Rubripirellula sp.]